MFSSSSTRCTVTWMGVQPPSRARNRNTRVAEPFPKSVVIAAISASSSGWTTGAPCLAGAPVVERARIVEPLEQGPGLQVDERAMNAGLGQAVQNSLCEVVRRRRHLDARAAPVHRAADQQVAAGVVALDHDAGGETDGDRIARVIADVPGAAEGAARLGLDDDRQHLRLTRVEIPGGQILGEGAAVGRLDGRVEAAVVERFRGVRGDSVGQVPFQRSWNDARRRIDVGRAHPDVDAVNRVRPSFARPRCESRGRSSA